MDDAAKLLLDSYSQLIELNEEQLTIAEKPRFDEQLDEIQKLEEQKAQYMAHVDQLSAQMLGEKQVDISNRDAIIQHIEQMQKQNTQLQQIITGWYNENSQTMKQVSTQRKTLNSYGGVNNSDIISYYFDEKQ